MVENTNGDKECFPIPRPDPSPPREWCRSGERARLRSGELGSADFGRVRVFQAEAGVSMANEFPPLEWIERCVKAVSGDGDLVGDVDVGAIGAGGGSGVLWLGFGDGVRASGDSGMCPTDFRRGE